MTDLDELERKARAATPGDWHWVIADRSMATLGVGDDPGDGTPHVLTVTPCKSCNEHAARNGGEWEWGRCWTPKEGDADFIAAANPAVILALIERVRAAEANSDELRKHLLVASTAMVMRGPTS